MNWYVISVNALFGILAGVLSFIGARGVEIVSDRIKTKCDGFLVGMVCSVIGIFVIGVCFVFCARMMDVLLRVQFVGGVYVLSFGCAHLVLRRIWSND